MRFTALLALVSSCLGVAAAPAEDSQLPTPNVVLTLQEQWRTESLEHSLTALVFTEVSCQRLIERLLVTLDTGERLVLEKEQIPSQGLERMKLMEDSTKWWAQLTRTSELRLKTQSSWDFARLPELLYLHRGEEWGVELSFSASGVPPFEMSSTNTESDFEQRFLAQLHHDGVTSTLVEDMPEAAERAIGFLRSMVESETGGGSTFLAFKSLIDLLAGGLDRHGDREALQSLLAHEWELVPARSRAVAKSTQVTDEAVLREVKAFQSVVDPADPLAGQHVSARDCR